MRVFKYLCVLFMVFMVSCGGASSKKTDKNWAVVFLNQDISKPLTTNQQKVKSSTIDLINKSFEKYNLDPTKHNILIRFGIDDKDLVGITIKAVYKGTTYYIIGFNDQYVEKNIETMMYESVPHEVSHLIDFLKNGDIVKHDKKWERICKSISSSPCDDTVTIN